MKYCARCCLLVLCLCGAACAAFPAAAQPNGKFGPKVEALKAEAQKDGRLQLSWSGGGFADNGKDIPEWIAAFNKFYGLHLPFTFTPAPSMPQQAAAVLQAAQTHTKAPTDLFIVGPDNLLIGYKDHATRRYDWAALAREIGVDLPPKAVALGNAGLAFATAVFGILYNKDAISPQEAPQTLEDVLKPKWKGRFATTPYAAGFNALAAFYWGPQKTEAFMVKLSHQAAGLIRCSEPGPLLSGQFDMIVLECDIASAIRDERQGMPIGYVVAKDAPVSNLWYVAVPETAPDPAAGALLALFLVTREGQEILWKSDGGDLSLLPGSHTAAEVPGGTAKVGTLAEFAAHPETVDYAKQYSKIVSGALRK